LEYFLFEFWICFGFRYSDFAFANEVSVATIQETLALALQRHQAGHLDEAEQLYKQILQANPYHPDGLHLMGVLISQRGRDDLAISYIERALTVKPNIAAFHNNLGYSYLALGWFEDAVHHFHEALRLQPNFAMAHNNIGKACREQGNFAQAMACYERAIAMQADYAEAHFNRAELWLIQGDFEKGWPEYEWRWELPKVGRRTAHPPRWDGKALGGRTILIHTEQGLGDTIHFIRYMPALQQLGGKVVVHCQAALLRLLASARGIDSMAAWHSTLPPFDVHEHLLNLPGVLHTSVASIPAEVPYLQTDQALLQWWKQELSDVRSPMPEVKGHSSDIGHRTSDTRRFFDIGIAWKGSAKNLTDQKRSVALSSFAALAQIEGVRLVSLQKGPGTEQLDELTNRFPILELGGRLDESHGAFMDSAAIMKNLDLIISCDTAVPHLAGALGVPVWVVLPYSPDWRWLLEREDSPWYPSMRLFRQSQIGQWDDVFERIAEELKKVAKDELGMKRG
jgi:TPR repeat/Tetratricopeptide repeat